MEWSKVLARLNKTLKCSLKDASVSLIFEEDVDYDQLFQCANLFE